MKNDHFNGKIAPEFIGFVKFTLLLAPLVMIPCGILFLLLAIFYENVEYAARILMFVMSGLSIAAGVAYPLITLHLIKIYPKHRNITKHFIKEYVFRDDLK